MTIVADVDPSWSIVPDPIRPTVADKSPADALVAIKLVMVADSEPNTVADAVGAIRLVIVALALVKTVMFPEPMLRLLRTILSAVKFVTDALVAFSVVMVADVDASCVIVPLPTRATVADRSLTEAVVANRLVSVADELVSVVTFPLA